MKSLEEHIQYFEDENNRYKSEHEKKNAQLQEAEEKTENLLKQVEQLRIDLTSEQRNIKRLEKYNAQLKDQLAKDKADINQLSDILEAYKNERFKLERAMREMQENLSKQSDENEITVLREGNDNLKRNLDDVLTQDSNLKNNIAELKEELIRTRKALDERSDINNKLFEENKALKEDFERFKCDNSEIQKKYDMSTTELEKAHKQTEELKKIKLQLTNEMDTIKLSYSSERLENQKLRNEISSLKNEEMQDKDILAKNKELSFNLMKLEKEILELMLNNEKQLLGIQRENGSLREQLQSEIDQKEACSKQVIELTRKLNLVVNKADSLRKKNDRTIKQISEMVPWCDKIKKQFNDIVNENTKSFSK